MTLHRTARRRGFSLVELLCVMAIIGILATMMLAPAAQAMKRARGLVGEMEEPVHMGEIRHKYQVFRSANKEHGRLDREGFIKSCELSWKCRDWLRSSAVTFSPFSASDPLERIVITYRSGVITRTVRYYSLSSLLEIPKLPE